MAEIERKVLITGASGLLGRQVLSVFKEANWNVTGLCFSRPVEGLIQHDISDLEQTKKLFLDLKPNLVVHAAAQRFPDKLEADYDKAFQLNVTSTRNLAELASSVGARLIYISTDYVFDGSNPPYKEDAAPQPTNRYGETKLEGEKQVLEVSASNIVLRIPILYGPLSYLNESALTSLLSSIKSDKPGKVSSYEVRCPAHTKDIAKIILDLGNVEPAGGIYQWSGLERLSKWDVLQIIHAETGLSISHLEELKGPSPGAVRPRDVEMSREKLEKLGISHHTDFKTGFMEVIKEYF